MPQMSNYSWFTVFFMILLSFFTNQQNKLMNLSSIKSNKLFTMNKLKW